mmetsp:Transcript_1268/g.1219  ORF Transcript_1268/g.1219 Transcript_1268/m.1219 type:complete len:92 (+) Transcript_1268:24-299(+)
MTLTDYEDKYFCRIKLKKFHLVKGGSKLEIMATFARSSGSDSYLEFYYGEYGTDYREVENEHMNLWTVETSSKGSSSRIDAGNFPEILYYV